MTNFLIAAFFILHFLQGNAEIRGEEDIMEFLYDYASHFSDYLYANGNYSENVTLIPTMYSYEEIQESVGSPLRCHLPLVLLSLLGFLL